MTSEGTPIYARMAAEFRKAGRAIPGEPFNPQPSITNGHPAAQRSPGGEANGRRLGRYDDKPGTGRPGHGAGG